MASTSKRYWLLKAEPDTRIVKGKDVRFSVDDFERVGTSPWEGVRNYEARNLMKEMKEGDQALFYHSNCKTPGIAAFAKVSKEAYPDYTAWDASHPYFDAKSDESSPKWFMVDLTFVSRAQNFIPLAVLRNIAALKSDTPPEGVEYLGTEGVRAIKNMNLVTRGRLSVQRVDEDAWSAVALMAEKGGFDALNVKAPKERKSGKAVDEDTGGDAQGQGQKSTTTAEKSGAANSSSKRPKQAPAGKGKGKGKGKKMNEDEDEDDEEDDEEGAENVETAQELEEGSEKPVASKRKRAAVDAEGLEGERYGLRRSTRSRK